MRRLLAVVLVSVAAPALAQVQSRPSDPPIVTAENDPWFARGDPIQFGGNTYLRAGAAVFFDGNRMVRSGSFDGVPLYVDTNLEPYSVVFVPVGRGLMQPYERPRTGELAGTTGSRPPSFPVSALPSRWIPPMAASAPTGLGTVPVCSDRVGYCTGSRRVAGRDPGESACSQNHRSATAGCRAAGRESCSRTLGAATHAGGDPASA
jgi:hypothetical protein